MMKWLMAFLLSGALLLYHFFGPQLMFYLMVKSHDQSHLTDAAMIANFHAKRNTFELLRTMIVADKGLERVDDTWTRPADLASLSIPPARIKEYRELFQDAGVPRGIEAYDLARNSFSLIGSSQGTTVHGSSKGYAWFRLPPDPLVPDLDAYAKKAGRHDPPAYRAIEAQDRKSVV